MCSAAVFPLRPVLAGTHDGDSQKGSRGTTARQSDGCGTRSVLWGPVISCNITLALSAIVLKRGEPDMGYVARSLAALSLGAALAGQTYGQLTGYYPMGADSLSLSNDDFVRMIDAANGLLRRSPLPVGTTTNWQNNQTGSTGTIRVTQTFRHGAMLCHRLVYETTPAGTPPANRTTLDWCDTGHGEWKILPS
jgi:surface antigen